MTEFKVGDEVTINWLNLINEEKAKVIEKGHSDGEYWIELIPKRSFITLCASISGFNRDNFQQWVFDECLLTLSARKTEVVNPLHLKIGDKIKLISFKNKDNSARSIDLDSQENRWQLNKIYTVVYIKLTSDNHICGQSNVKNPVLDNSMSAWWGTFVYAQTSSIGNKVRNLLTNEVGTLTKIEDNKIWVKWNDSNIEFYIDSDVAEIDEDKT